MRIPRAWEDPSTDEQTKEGQTRPGTHTHSTHNSHAHTLSLSRTPALLRRAGGPGGHVRPAGPGGRRAAPGRPPPRPRGAPGGCSAPGGRGLAVLPGPGAAQGGGGRARGPGRLLPGRGRAAGPQGGRPGRRAHCRGGPGRGVGVAGDGGERMGASCRPTHTRTHAHTRSHTLWPVSHPSSTSSATGRTMPWPGPRVWRPPLPSWTSTAWPPPPPPPRPPPRPTWTRPPTRWPPCTSCGGRPRTPGTRWRGGG